MRQVSTPQHEPLPENVTYLSRASAACSNRHVGLFTDFEQAVAARKSAETKAGFHPNHGRAPKQMEV